MILSLIIIKKYWRQKIKKYFYILMSDKMINMYQLLMILEKSNYTKKLNQVSSNSKVPIFKVFLKLLVHQRIQKTNETFGRSKII